MRTLNGFNTNLVHVQIMSLIMKIMFIKNTLVPDEFVLMYFKGVSGCGRKRKRTHTLFPLMEGHIDVGLKFSFGLLFFSGCCSAVLSFSSLRVWTFINPYRSDSAITVRLIEL